MIVPDINRLIYAYNDGAPHHHVKVSSHDWMCRSTLENRKWG